MLAEILHAQDSGTVLIRIKIAQGQRIAQAAVVNIRSLSGSPLRIGEDIDIRLLALSHRLRISVHSHILVRHILEIQHPVVKDVLFPFRNQKVSLYHKLGIQTDKALCMVHGLPAGSVNGIHNHLVKLHGIHTGLALDTAGSCITACNGAVIEQQHLGILVQSLLFRSVYRHIRNHSSGRILGQFIGFSQGIDLYYVVSVESRLDDRTRLAETGLASANFRNRVIRFC